MSIEETVVHDKTDLYWSRQNTGSSVVYYFLWKLYNYKYKTEIIHLIRGHLFIGYKYNIKWYMTILFYYSVTYFMQLHDY